MNESCHICMSHVTYDWVMSRMDESCHVRLSDSAYRRVISNINESWYQQTSSLKPLFMLHINESWLIWMGHVTYQWVMSHINESCHIWMSHVTYKWVMSRKNESYMLAAQGYMIPRGTYMNESYQIYSLILRIHVWHDSFIRDRNGQW